MIDRRELIALVFLALAAAPSSAEIYGYMDDKAPAHLSDVRLDSRYDVYMKDKPHVEQALPAEILPEVVPGPERPAVEMLTLAQGRNRYRDMIQRVAREQKIDAALLHAVVAVESGYNAHAKSPKGATGLMQLMPATAKRYGVSDLLDPLENLRAGARYLRDLLHLFKNNLRLAIAAYNAGEGAVMRFGNSIPPYRETRAYVPRVLEHYQRYRASFRSS